MGGEGGLGGKGGSLGGGGVIERLGRAEHCIVYPHSSLELLSRRDKDTPGRPGVRSGWRVCVRGDRFATGLVAVVMEAGWPCTNDRPPSSNRCTSVLSATLVLRRGRRALQDEPPVATERIHSRRTPAAGAARRRSYNPWEYGPRSSGNLKQASDTGDSYLKNRQAHHLTLTGLNKCAASLPDGHPTRRAAPFSRQPRSPTEPPIINSPPPAPLLSLSLSPVRTPPPRPPTTMPRNLKIALVQFNPLPPDHSHDAHAQNLAKAHAFVREAAGNGAQLVVFPEYFLSGGEL